MKKFVSMALAVFLSLSLLAGCGSQVTTGNASTAAGTSAATAASAETTAVKDVKPVELTMWHELEPGVADTISQQLKKLEPEIKVNLVRKEKSTEALKLIASDPNGAPDLYWYAHDKIGLFATMGVLEPLDQYVSVDKFNGLVPMTVKAGTFDSKKYQIPVYYETLLFMYNKKLLSSVPKTTDELLAMMKEKTKGGNYGFVEQHSTAYYVAAWINGFGGYIINDKAEPGLNRQETMDAVAYHKEFVPFMPKDGEWNTVTTLFKEGKAAATINGPWLVADVRKAGIDLGFAALPAISKNNKPLSPYAGVQGVMMLKASKNKEAAAKVLNFLAEKDLGEALALSTGAAPANLKAYDNEKVKTDELIIAMKAQAENATPMPNIPEMDVMWTVTENALAAINKNNADVKTEMEKAQNEALKGIAAMK